MQQIRDERASAPPPPPPGAQIVQPHDVNVQSHNINVQTHNEIMQTHTEPPPRRRARWVVPVAVVGSVLVVGAAVTLGLVFGLDKRDTFKSTPLGTVDFR